MTDKTQEALKALTKLELWAGFGRNEHEKPDVLDAVTTIRTALSHTYDPATLEKARKFDQLVEALPCLLKSANNLPPIPSNADELLKVWAWNEAIFEVTRIANLTREDTK